MITSPDVSVVLPVYNGQEYLRQSIDSVLEQSCGKFELIIWDDQSTDDSAKIIGEYNDRRIRRFVNTRNLGLFPTLNLAIAEAQAPLIRLWSQDDVMKRNCLEEELSFLDRNPDVGMSYCCYDVIDNKGTVIYPTPDDPTPDVVSPTLAAQIMFYHGSITGNIANVTLKKSVIKEMGGFREDMRIAGDFEMWVRISERFPIGYLRRPMIYLRSHDGQFSRQAASYVTCMSEEQTIYATLLQRQPASEWEYARKYNRRHRYLQYVHFMIRHLLMGHFKTAFASYKAIREIDNPSLLFGLWVLTADQRLFKMKSKYQLTQARA
jgi:glycosyltransferase involved in cell wall biosynthesis